jgi:hypothetical protein
VIDRLLLLMEDPALMRRIRFAAIALAGFIAIAGAFLFWRTRPGPGRTPDEASAAGFTGFTVPVEDYFHAMDGGADLATDEVQGRNLWMVASGGNDRFWDLMARQTHGGFDLLKVVSSYDPDADQGVPADRKEALRALYPVRHANRFELTGLINEPCYDAAPGPNARRYGLWLDERKLDCTADPFENANRYPGVRGSLYGAPAGIVGLRLFPNPDFNAAAAKRWDPVRYYNDPSYYGSPDLVRPYRVGVTCALCHTGFHPNHMPEDPANPLWDDLSSVAGARSLRMDQVARWQPDESSFPWQLLHAARPGTFDTSLAASDQVFNPRAVNPLWGMAARMKLARVWGRETLDGGSIGVRQISNYVAGGPLTGFFEPPSTVWTPRLGIAGADSVGVLAGVHRWFADSGMFSEEMLYHHHPLVGGKQSPVTLGVMRERSAQWRFMEEAVPDVVRFLMNPGKTPKWMGAIDAAAANRGKAVFAERCAACHSSKFPTPPASANPGACSGNYLDCWNRYWTWTASPEYRKAIAEIVASPDFLENNFLSNDLRVPLPLVGTNACSALGGNGGGGRLWEDFTSETYKKLPSAGSITWYHPESGEPHTWSLPASGVGYLRPPSLIAVWSSAPFLTTNSVGRADFQDAMEQLLWPDRRERDSQLGQSVPGTIPRTTAASILHIPASLVPDEFAALLTREAVEIQVPAGTPVALLANLDASSPRALALLRRLKKQSAAGLTDALLELSTCPDLIVNRGHYFGTGLDGAPALTDAQKRDLIEFMKMF